MLKTWFVHLFDTAMDLNRKQILSDLPRNGGRLLDLGCDNGDWTLALAAVTPRDGVHGVEVVEERAAVARSRGVDVVIADLARVLPLTTDAFDVVHANQVIEHVPDVDREHREHQQLAQRLCRILWLANVFVDKSFRSQAWDRQSAGRASWRVGSLEDVDA